MNKQLYTPDLICAESSPGGQAGVSVIRVSGEKAVDLFKEIFFEDSNFESRCVYFKNYYSKENKFLDEVICFCFDDEKSFTGEPSFEVQCHGSPLVVKSIINDLFFRGVRLAEPGEFSYRSYLNNKMDLVKAESIHHLIHSRSNAVREMSLNLLEGKFNSDLSTIKEKLLLALSRLEAMIDFSDQDIDLEQEDIIKSALTEANDIYDDYISSFKFSNVHLKGLNVSLIGPPNSGKSSLFNQLLKFDRSIVSDVAGTTRDYVSEIAYIGEYSFKLTDTAGVRDSVDKVEVKGIEKSSVVAESSQLVLLLVSDDTLDEFKAMLEKFDKSILDKAILVRTKKDIKDIDLEIGSLTSISISTLSSHDIKSLRSVMKNKLKPYFNINKNLFIERQYSLIQESKDALVKASELSLLGHEDIISSLLYKALSLVDEVLYIEDPEAVRDKIFSDFCLGK